MFVNFFILDFDWKKKQFGEIEKSFAIDEFHSYYGNPIQKSTSVLIKNLSFQL